MTEGDKIKRKKRKPNTSKDKLKKVINKDKPAMDPNINIGKIWVTNRFPSNKLKEQGYIPIPLFMKFNIYLSLQRRISKEDLDFLRTNFAANFTLQDITSNKILYKQELEDGTQLVIESTYINYVIDSKHPSKR